MKFDIIRTLFFGWYQTDIWFQYWLGSAQYKSEELNPNCHCNSPWWNNPLPPQNNLCHASSPPPRLRSPEEPRGCGQARRPQHHPEERHRLPAESHQRGADHDSPPPAQSPAHPTVRAGWRGTGGRKHLKGASICQQEVLQFRLHSYWSVSRTIPIFLPWISADTISVRYQHATDDAYFDYLLCSVEC